MSEDRFEQIERYLSNQMADAEKLLFEQELAVNTELYTDVQVFSVLKSAMLDEENYIKNSPALMHAFDALNHEFFLTDGRSEDEKPVLNLRKTRFIYARSLRRILAAAVLIGVIASGLLWLKKSKENGSFSTAYLHMLFAKNFTRDAVPAEKEEALQSAFDYYDRNEKELAMKAFEQPEYAALTRGLETDTALIEFYAVYYKAQIWLSSDSAGKAINELETALSKEPEDTLLAKTRWYLALAYLKNAEVKKAVEYLKLEAGDDSSPAYKTKAEQLLHQVEHE